MLSQRSSKEGCSADCPTVEAVYQSMRPYIRWLAGRSVNSHPLMSADEIEGELNLELVKGCRHYQGKSLDDLTRLLKTILKNRVYELRKHYFRADGAEMMVVGLEYAEVLQQPDVERWVGFLAALRPAERKWVDLALAGRFGRSVRRLRAADKRLHASVGEKWRETYD